MKRTLLVFLLSVLVVFAFAYQAYAVQEAGDTELAVVAAAVSYLDVEVEDDDDEVVLEDVSIEDEQTLFTVGLRMSSYLTQAWQLGLGLTGSYNFDTDNANVSLDAFLNYNFVTPDSVVVPYVGIGGGANYIEIEDEDELNPQVGGQAGVKFYIAENIHLFGEFNYRYIYIDDTPLDDAHNLAGLFGVGVLF
jgi:outer membrane protein W